jgi:hypothetical protein
LSLFPRPNILRTILEPGIESGARAGEERRIARAE